MDADGNGKGVRHVQWSIAFICGLLNCLQAGTFFMTPTTLMPLIVKDFGISIAQASVAVSIGKLSYVLMLVPGGLIFGFFGLAATTLLYSGVVSYFWQLVTVHILLSVFSATCGVPVYAVIIANTFFENLGLAMGIVLSGFSFSGTVIPTVLAPIASAYGWRMAMLTMSSILWLAGLPLTLLILRNPTEDLADDRSELSDSYAAALTEATYEKNGSGLDGEKFYLYVLFSLSYFILQYMIGSFQENILYFLHSDIGIELPVASLYFAGINFAAFGAKLMSGALGDRFDRFRTACILSVLTTVGISMLFLNPTFPHLVHSRLALAMFSILFGIGYGSTFSALYALPATVFGTGSLGQIQSALFATGLAGNALGAIITGVLRTRHGSYNVPFLMNWALSIMNTLILVAVAWSDGAKRCREELLVERMLGESTESFLPMPSEDFISIPSYDSVQGSNRLYWQRRRNATVNTFAALRHTHSTMSVHGTAATSRGGGMLRSSGSFFDILHSGFLGNTMEFTGFEPDSNPRGLETSRSVVGLSASILQREQSVGNLYQNRDPSSSLFQRD